MLIIHNALCPDNLLLVAYSIVTACTNTISITNSPLCKTFTIQFQTVNFATFATRMILRMLPRRQVQISDSFLNIKLNWLILVFHKRILIKKTIEQVHLHIFEFNELLYFFRVKNFIRAWRGGGNPWPWFQILMMPQHYNW